MQLLQGDEVLSDRDYIGECGRVSDQHAVGLIYRQGICVRVREALAGASCQGDEIGSRDRMSAETRCLVEGGIVVALPDPAASDEGAEPGRDREIVPARRADAADRRHYQTAPFCLGIGGRWVTSALI